MPTPTTTTTTTTSKAAHTRIAPIRDGPGTRKAGFLVEPRVRAQDGAARAAERDAKARLDRGFFK